ncbi:partial Formate hydrogenlyase transcriptional activator FhlA, partial [Anaerolineae bacterium]
MAVIRQHRGAPSSRISENGNTVVSFGCAGEVPFERRRFDRLLLSLSTRLKNASPKDLDKEIDAGLKDAIVYFGGDRITLWEFVEGGKLAVMTHFFAENGTEPPVRSVLHEEMPYILSRIEQNQIFRMSRTADLPESASLDRERLQRSGVISMLSVPIFMAGTPRGCLSLATIRSEREWSAETIMQLTRIAAVLGNVLERKVSFNLLEERVRFETLIADLSARFINISSEEVDEAISAALDRVRTFYHADYCALFEADVATSETRLPYISYAPNVIRLPEDIIPRQAFPWAYDIVFLQGKPNIRERNDDFPPEAEIDRKSNKAIGVEAAINIPVDYGSPTAYCLTVATVRQRSWPAEYIPRVRLLGEIIVEALKRKRLDVELKRSYEEIVTLKNRLELEADYLRSEIRIGREHEAIIGQSEALTNVLMQVEQVAPTSSTVLICGETGTGKELVAQAVHNLSSRRDRLLVTVNCASLPAALVESELFGREKGAYTGALSRQAGRFEL